MSGAYFRISNTGEHRLTVFTVYEYSNSENAHARMAPMKITSLLFLVNDFAVEFAQLNLI